MLKEQLYRLITHEKFLDQRFNFLIELLLTHFHQDTLRFYYILTKLNLCLVGWSVPFFIEENLLVGVSGEEP